MAGRKPFPQRLLLEAGVGEKTDAEVAEICGISEATVGKHRRAMGIAAFRPRAGSNPQRKAMWLDAGLGVKPYAEVARTMGTTRQAAWDAALRYGLREGK